LSRPDVAAGPRRDLVEALHDLHHRAGWPSLRVIARQVGCSPTTVSAVFTAPRLPAWGLLELVVEALDGDVDRFRGLWLAAGSPDPTWDLPMAGRVAELDTVRRALESPGLLLVTGEAGIGKTTLVATASLGRSVDSRVARGAGLPLSGQVPLLPIADAFRSVWELDNGNRVREVLAGCAPYVADTLGTLLPELGTPVPSPAGRSSRQRILSAVSAALVALAGRGPFALVLEDLHWADSGTLDIVEYLVSRRSTVPVVATWRLADPATPSQHLDWLGRVARDRWVNVLELGPLSREETALQLALLGADLPLDRVFTRSLGQPLFTEQLASHDASDLPVALADLLDRRLGRLDATTWPLVRALGVAARPLPERVLPAVTGLGFTDLADGIRRLRALRLVAPGRTPEVALQHPLLAEAVERRTTATERAEQHRSLAVALGTEPGRSAAEVAEHWHGAGDPEAELTWRLQAARDAWSRLALDECRTQWRRVLALWPEDRAEAGEPPVHVGTMLIEAIDAMAARDAVEALRIADRAQDHLASLTAEETAALYQRIGDLTGAVHSPTIGLGYVSWALRIYERLPPSAGHVEALERLEGLLGALGRRSDGAAAAARGVEVAREVRDPRQLRRLIALHGWHLAASGRVDEADGAFVEAAAVEVPGGDPIGDVELACGRTDVLLRCAAPAAEIAAAAAPGLAVADRWQLTTYGTSVLRGNVGQALLQAGDPDGARAVVDPGLVGGANLDTWAAHLQRAELDVAAGDLETALARFTAIEALGLVSIAQRAEVMSRSVVARCWLGRHQEALDLVLPLLEETLTTEDPDSCWLLLVPAARAAADASSKAAAHRVARVAGAARGCMVAALPAQQAMVGQELARSRDRDRVQDWIPVAVAWDRLARPYDAAYARLRGAQAARRSGDQTTAQQLLRRAARDARRHRPLTDAIGAT
jgi:hypothetical protein